MILSFHPLIEADLNILCAGRIPNEEDLSAIKRAQAVILPQGCKQVLYELAAGNCPYVFPNYKARFEYPGKIGQAHLFRDLNQNYPYTEVFADLDAFYAFYALYVQGVQSLPFKMPFVAKFDWGGEGSNVHLIRSDSDFDSFLKTAERYEKTGQKGFVVQAYIPSSQRTLRVVIIGRNILTYWRIQRDPDRFAVNVSQGAEIDIDGDPDLQRQGAEAVRIFCDQSGINLAGFDLLFSDNGCNQPFFLEINYFFGRRGIGGSNTFYRILEVEVRNWINSVSQQ